jgi:hypothetical protein
MAIKRVVIVEFADTSDIPKDGDLSHAVELGLVRHGYEPKQVTVMNKDLLLWFREQNAFVQLRDDETPQKPE